MPRLRVLAGPSPSAAVDITGLVNTSTPHTISSDLFQGQIVVSVKDFTDPDGNVFGSNYFARPDRKGITWSIQVQGRFLQSHSADDILFGNTFDRPLKLPWGSSAALAFAKFVDPTLEQDLTSNTKPWALSPLISTMPHFVHERLGPSSSSSSSCDSLFEYNVNAQVTPKAATFAKRSKGSVITLPPFPPKDSIADDTSQLHLAVVEDISLSDISTSSNSSLSSIGSFHSARSNFSQGSSKRREKKIGKHINKQIQLRTAGERRSYFSVAKHRREIRFGPEDLITTDFCYGFLEFSPSLVLRLPAGVSFDLMKYWDGQPVRFVCCERKKVTVDGNESDSERSAESQEGLGDPWGRLFWCIMIELVDEQHQQ